MKTITCKKELPAKSKTIETPTTPLFRGIPLAELDHQSSLTIYID